MTWNTYFHWSGLVFTILLGLMFLGIIWMLISERYINYVKFDQPDKIDKNDKKK